MNPTFNSLYSAVTGEAAKPNGAERPRSSNNSANGRPTSSSAQVHGQAAGVKRRLEEPSTSNPVTKKPNIGTPSNGSFQAAMAHRQPPANRTHEGAASVAQASLNPKARPASSAVSNTAPSSKSSQTPSKALNAVNRPTASSTKPAPPTGSYAQMIAKAAQAKQLPSDANVKKDSAGPKLSLKQRQAQLLQEKERARQARKSGNRPVASRPAGSSSASTASKASGRAAVEPIKPKRQPTDLGYKGTMRPVESSAAPPKKPPVVKTQSRPTSSKPGMASHSSRYRYASESEEEYSEDDGSDDMEDNGFGALEQEEELSLRAARKEDAEALREETEHSRKKAERRRQLEALKASRRK